MLNDLDPKRKPVSPGHISQFQSNYFHIYILLGKTGPYYQVTLLFGTATFQITNWAVVIKLYY